MRAKKGVVLLVTLMLLMLLLGLMNIFLVKTKEAKDDVVYEFALNQTNLVMHNIFEIVKHVNFDEDTIFYASKISFPLNFGSTDVILKVDSAQKYIDLNSMLRMTLKDDFLNGRFLSWLEDYKLENSQYFLDLLQDTIDTDKDPRSGDSEIIEEYPNFRNGAIYSKSQLNKIIDYYYEKTGDEIVYKLPIYEMFSVDNQALDLNFASFKILEFVMDDADSYLLKSITKHSEVYEKIKDLPFDDTYKKKIKKGLFGQRFTTKTELLDVDIKLTYKTHFKSHITFKYNVNSKKIIDYNLEIDEYKEMP